jgi:hypothetical protein
MFSTSKTVNLFIETAKTLGDYRIQSLVRIYRSGNLRESNRLVKYKLKEIFRVGLTRAKAKREYQVLELKSLKRLSEFKNHRKIKVFLSKGCVCAGCGLEGCLLVKHRESDRISWTVVTKDLIEMNVDHIIPRSRGGGEGLYNKQPMCVPCNQSKGKKASGVIPITHVGVSTGDMVFAKRGGKFLNVGQVTCIQANKIKTKCNKMSPAYKPWYSHQELYKIKMVG